MLGIPDLVSTVYTSIYGFAKHPGALTETIVLKTMSKHPTQSGLQAGNNLGGGRGSSSAAGVVNLASFSVNFRLSNMDEGRKSLQTITESDSSHIY